jgi:Zn-dependent M28 family amino/carboxypeptidase
MSLWEFARYLGVRIIFALISLRNARHRARRPPLLATPVVEVLAGERCPLALAHLLARRANREREAALTHYLKARGIPFAQQRFSTFEGNGENLSIDVGEGDRVLILIAHHDVVPGSPGANDNAAAVGILLALLDRLPALALTGMRVRLLFTGAEERAYLGARAYVRATALEGVIGVLSLELCGIGDSLVLWDVTVETPFLRHVTEALDAVGLRRDETYHVVGKIPLFGSDHRAFAGTGVSAYGLTVVPSAEAAQLRDFVLNSKAGALKLFGGRPRPFDTYHTAADDVTTLDSAAMALVTLALEEIIVSLAAAYRAGRVK